MRLVPNQEFESFEKYTSAGWTKAVQAVEGIGKMPVARGRYFHAVKRTMANLTTIMTGSLRM
jgi:hypothetical protein